jgi:signal transduction histidine kinase/CheY-like chemotaxis protein
MSYVYIETNLLEKALIYLLRAEENLNQYSADSNSRGYYNYTFGLYFMKKDMFNNAITKFENALTILEGNKNINGQDNLLLIVNTYEKLAVAFNKEDLNGQAYNAILKYNSFKDVFINETKEEQNFIANSNFLIEDYKKDAQIANTERIEQVEITNYFKNINFIISIALFLFFILLITLYKNYISKRKLTHTLRVQNIHLEHARNEAEKSSQLKSKFISNVTHELRTPLYGVVGITSLLLENNDLSERDNKFLNSLKYSGDYLLNLINDILQVSKIESQNIELKNTSVSLNKLITNIVDSFNYKLQETNNKIKVSIDSLLPDQIKCDNVRLSQVLINLIGNSVKFTESGNINIRVKLLKLNADTVDMRFEIEDTGCGIPEHKFDTIFDTFSQLDENNNVNYQGTGLGLSITKNIVELFDSEIELSSIVGEGSTFSFNVSFEIDKSITNNVQHKGLVKTIPLKESYSILIAEDNKINQIVTQNLLKKNNFKSVVVGNGLEAVELLKTENFDLILMDINMPIMDGYKATEAIREFNSEIPIVALTASDVESMRKGIVNKGFNDIISKPFDNYEFFQVIETNIEQSKLNTFENPLVMVS